jgi:DNA-binding NtrC family response regulator
MIGPATSASWHYIERAVALCEEDLIERTDFDKLTQVKIAIRDLDEYEITLDALEEQHIKKVLQKVGGDKVKASQILGINLDPVSQLARYEGYRSSKSVIPPVHHYSFPVAVPCLRQW